MKRGIGKNPTAFNCVWKSFNPFFPRVINFKFLLQPHQKYHITQYEDLGFSYLNQMKDDYTTNLSLPLLYISFWNVGRMYFFQLGSERVNAFAFFPISSFSSGRSQITIPKHNAHWVTSMAMNADKRKWRHVRISAVSNSPGGLRWAHVSDITGRRDSRQFHQPHDNDHGSDWQPALLRTVRSTFDGIAALFQSRHNGGSVLLAVLILVFHVLVNGCDEVDCFAAVGHLVPVFQHFSLLQVRIQSGSPFAKILE